MLHTGAGQITEQEPALSGRLLRLSKKSIKTFFDSLENAVAFPLPGSGKALSAFAARLAHQGFAGHLIPLEAGFAPSSSPDGTQRFTPNERSLTR